MATIADLASASAKLRSASSLPDEEYDRRIRNHVKYLRQLLSSKALESVARDDSLFDEFDPASDSITYLFLLRIQIQALQEASRDTLPDLSPSGAVWLRAKRYLEIFDSVQVRYAGLEWRQLVEFIARAAQNASQPLLAIRPVREAMLRLDPSCAVFTSTHLLFIRLCLHAKAYTSALPVLDSHICQFPSLSGRPSSTSFSLPCSKHESSLGFITESSGLSSKVSYKDYLQYFLYGGMVYMALKQWRKASHFLAIVISMPTLGCISMIMVEAYKKWVLVGLIQDGKLRTPPVITSPNVAKLYQSLAKPYINLAHAFERDDLTKLRAEVDAAQEVWVIDHNMGLVSQVMEAFSKHAVIKLRETFAALTVTELLKQSSLFSADRAAAELAIASHVMSGALRATLVQSSNLLGETMLRFSSTSFSQPSHETAIQTRCLEERQMLGSLMISLEESSRTMGLSDEFADSMQKGQTWAAGSQADQGFGQDAGLEMDEDIMGEVS